MIEEIEDTMAPIKQLQDDIYVLNRVTWKFQEAPELEVVRCIPESYDSPAPRYEEWLSLKVTTGDLIELAGTDSLPYLRDSELSRIKGIKNLDFSTEYYFDEVNDILDEDPNSVYMFLGQKAIFTDNRPLVNQSAAFYKLLDVSKNKVKWVKIEDIKEKVRKAQRKTIHLRRKFNTNQSVLKMLIGMYEQP